MWMWMCECVGHLCLLYQMWKLIAVILMANIYIYRTGL